MDQPINILIVDDEPKNLTVLETVLDDPSYRLVRAESADKALLALVAEEFALLILDIRMPGMTGFELAQIIKERRKTARVPIIFLTAYYNEDQHVLTGYDSGAVDYLHKPVSAPILRSKVAVFAELHRTQRECGLANHTLLAEMTERRRAEEQLRVLNETLEQRVAERTEALRESEEQLRRIFKQSPAGIVQTDEHGNMTLVNDRWCEMLGFSRAELLGRNVAEVTDASSLEATLENVRRLAEGGPDFQIEKNYRRKDGTILQVQSNVAGLRDAAGRYQGLLAVVLDLTERHRAEAARRLTNERLTLAVECSQVVLFQQDLELRYTWLHNPALGIDGSNAVGKGDADLLERAEDAALTEALKREVIRSGVSQRQEVMVQIAGVGRHYDLLMEPLRDAAGLITGITGAAVDITERKRAEEALREASEKAVAANAAKDRFLAALSHELRTPLTPVLLVSEVHARSEKLSEDLREDFEMIHRNIVLEAQLIDDLLDVSRIQQGKMRFDFKLVDVNEALARALDMLRSEVEEKGITVQQEMGAPPAAIEADPNRLRQVLCNLLRNAVKFTPRGGTITVRTAREFDDLQISVADTGAGIAAENLERIFQPFEQVDAQQGSEHCSLGLGLAISGAIVAAHRGRIWAESPGPGQGSTFHMRLPF